MTKMSRKEEIINAGIDYTMKTQPVCICGGAFEEQMREFNRNGTFESAAEWADETLIEKFKDWLFDHFVEDTYDGDYNYGKPYIYSSFDTIEEMMSSLDKAMKE